MPLYNPVTTANIVDGTIVDADISSSAAIATSKLALASGGTITGDLQIQGTDKAYRLRRGGSALDLDATGVDLLISNFSGTDFDGTQRAYLRLSADAQNVQVAGKVEYVDALYGTVAHVLDGDGDTVGFHGATPVTQQTVTGSRGGNAALASLLTALDALGLIVDGSEA